VDSWLNDCGEVKLNKQVLVDYKTYEDEMKMNRENELKNKKFWGWELKKKLMKKNERKKESEKKKDGEKKRKENKRTSYYTKASDLKSAF
jgi:hypothetical protein